jgi:hypothetical protein
LYIIANAQVIFGTYDLIDIAVGVWLTTNTAYFTPVSIDANNSFAGCTWIPFNLPNNDVFSGSTTDQLIVIRYGVVDVVCVPPLGIE